MRTPTTIALCLLLLLPAAARGADPSAGKLVDQLADDDPDARDRAARALLALGRDARPPLVDAVNGDEPHLRAAAADVLLRLPFDAPDDPPAAARALREQYTAAADPGARVACLARLRAALAQGADPVLLRLVREDPSDEVRWGVVGLLRTESSRRALAAHPVDRSVHRAPNLALAAWRTELTDRPAALKLYHRVLAEEADRPTADRGEAEFVYQSLIAAALEASNPARAAAVLRARHARATPDAIEAGGDARPRAGNTLDDLFALHADFGPLAGFAADVAAAHADQLARPQTLHALGRLHARRLGQPLVADALHRAAATAAALDPAARLAAAEFLVQRQWDDLARPAFESIVADDPAAGPPSPALITAHFRLGVVRARGGDDFAAAEHHRAAMEAIQKRGAGVVRVRNGRRLRGKEAADASWAEIHWRYLRAARDKGDAAAADRHLDALLSFDPADDTTAFDAVPALLDRGRAAEADRLFDRAYALSRAALDETPHDVVRMNNLAWLCARGRRRLDEALALITAATTGKPENPAHLDTAAEIHFQLGRLDDAIRLQRRAVELRPKENFQKQLQKFLDAKAKGGSATTRPAVR